MTPPHPASQGPEVLLVTGMSGAGRSTVGKVLEDIGYVVVGKPDVVIDNLPLSLLDEVVRLHDIAEGDRRLAATVDVRTGVDSDALHAALRTLRRQGIAPMVVFLDAADDTLATRYDEVRRPHPVEGATVLESIAAERDALTEIREAADVVIDFSLPEPTTWHQAVP